MKKLKHLELNFNRFPQMNWIQSIHSFKNSVLESLAIKSNYLSTYDVKDLADRLPQSLTRLILHNNYLKDDCLVPLLNKLKTLPVSELDLVGNARLYGTDIFFQKLSKLQDLKVLSLRHNNLGEDGMKNLVHNFLSSTMHLEKLDLSENNLESYALAFLNPWISQTKSLKSLILNRNKFQSDLELLNFFSCLQDIEELDLGFTLLSRNGIKMALDLITKKKIKKLNLLGNNFPNEIGEYLLKILKEIKDNSLKEIYFYDYQVNQITLDNLEEEFSRLKITFDAITVK